jgi:N-acetylated-alpha-linked acidic dipeptidase
MVSIREADTSMTSSLLGRSLFAFVCVLLLFTSAARTQQPSSPAPFGFRNFTAEQQLESHFLAVPDPKLAEEHLRILTAEPHIAGSPEDKKTADYVAQRFREDGFDVEVTEYKVWMNLPEEISVSITNPPMPDYHAPRREHVSIDPFQDDARITPGFNEYSPSGDVEAEVVYANYGRPEDFRKLEEQRVDVRGKIVIMRYGENYRGVKEYLAELHGAAGVIIYSDPMDDGYFKGDKYPDGPWRPDSGVQRGSVLYMFRYPGDPTTPGIASTPSLPDSQRTPPENAANMPRIPTTPLCYADARPILENLGGPLTPRPWQGALPFAYHMGPGPVRVKIHLKQEYQYRTIWDVVAKVQGTQAPDEWVIAGNHRDAWVYGAVDPNSGTAAMLEAAHGIGELLKSGWKPKRTLMFASWDAEEEGLIGSTEWAEQHEKELARAAGYFNMDVGVDGPNFNASAVPSLKQFVRDVTKAVSSPAGGTVYDAWKEKRNRDNMAPNSDAGKQPASPTEVRVGDLGSGSDFTAFLQHLGVPATDITSGGDYGVYHSVFDNFAWFKKFGDPTFAYEQQMARVFGLEALRMADSDVLPYDYGDYGREITSYLEAAQKKSVEKLGKKSPDYTAALNAARRMTTAGIAIAVKQRDASADAAKLNRVLRDAEAALLLPGGLPNRPWFRHAVYAPGEYTGYAAVVIPGVNEAIEAGDDARTQQQLAALTAAINRAAEKLESFR